MTSQRIVGPVVVGVDGSTANTGALRYGVAAARRLRTFLMLVHVVPDHVPIAPVRPIDPDELNQLGASVLSRAEEQVREVDADIDVEGWLHHGTRAVELAGAARLASLLVVGRDDRTLVERLLRGDTATATAARATVPVVEVPAGWEARPAGKTPTVLVGIKSPESPEALIDDAFAQAELLGGGVVVLHAWRLPSEYDDIIGARVAVEDWRREVRDILEPHLAPWRKRYPDVPVELRVVHGHPAQALVRAAEEADLVVIARRAHGLPAAAHLGTTARAVLRSADCPVRVLPPVAVEEIGGGDLVEAQPESDVVAAVGGA